MNHGMCVRFKTMSVSGAGLFAEAPAFAARGKEHGGVHAFGSVVRAGIDTTRDAEVAA